ncbi:MAG TPA: hypothetical protein PKD72_01690 [Gemmatales bacterium]|nr:hypothetical protein [Gemmatales bacterium]
MSSPKVWRTMWETTGKLAEMIGISLPGMEGTAHAERPATRCPNCEQKLRYAASKAGAKVKCPRCAHRFPLPLKPRPVFPKFSARVGYSEIRHRV